VHTTSHPLAAAISLTAAAGLALAGCTLDESSTPAAGGASGGTDMQCEGSAMAYLTPGISVPFWRYMSVGIERAAEPFDVEVTTYDSNNSAATQLQNAQDAITAGVSAIIISPTDSASAPAVLELATKAGVPVVISDIGTDSGEFVSYVATDNSGGAAEAGEYLAERLAAEGYQDSPVGIVGISQSRQNGQARTEGFSEAITKGGHEILPLLESADYSRDEGLSLAQDLKTANPDMHGLFTQHDEATLGALTAVQADDELIIVGFDGSPESFQAIQDGRLAGASMQQPVLMGATALESACGYLDGEQPEEFIELSTIMVTSDNVDEIEDEVKENVFVTE